MIAGLTAEQTRDLILSVGTHQDVRALTPVEIATYFQTALDAGASRKDIADSCLLETTVMIGRFLRLLKLAPEIRHLVIFGSGYDSLSFTQAMEIARLSDSGVQLELVDMVLENGMSKDEVRETCQLIERSGLGVNEAVGQILKLRPTIERIFVLIGSIQEGSARSFLESKTQFERDEILRGYLAVAGFQGSGHLGVDRFTLTAQDEPSLTVAELEAGLNDLLFGGSG